MPRLGSGRGWLIEMHSRTLQEGVILRPISWRQRYDTPRRSRRSPVTCCN